MGWWQDIKDEYNEERQKAPSPRQSFRQDVKDAYNEERRTERPPAQAAPDHRPATEFGEITSRCRWQNCSGFYRSDIDNAMLGLGSPFCKKHLRDGQRWQLLERVRWFRPPTLDEWSRASAADRAQWEEDEKAAQQWADEPERLRNRRRY